jgi:hypothetical protein
VSETGRFWIPGLAGGGVDAVDPVVGEELATVVGDPDVVVGPVEPPDVHDAITRAAPPISATATFRPAVVTWDRSPDGLLLIDGNLLPGPNGDEPGETAEVGRCARPRRMRDPGAMSESGTTLSPRLSDPQLDGEHERMSHIVLEGFKPEEGDFVSAGPSVVEGMVNGTAVRALCGKIWVPGRDPKRYGICPTCKEIAEAQGWKVPAG